MCNSLHTGSGWRVALLVLVWAGLALAIWPSGEFPLNDDWSYARAVQGIVQDAQFHLGGWTSMPLVVQALWGALFCLPMGFSFIALRCSTLVLGLVGILATYGLAREAGASRNHALLAALVLAANPLYVSLSATFMTDVPFLALALVSLLLLSRSLRTGQPGSAVAGIVAAVAATLIRQTGAVIPLAFALAWVVQRRRSVAPLAARVPVVGLVAVWGSLLAYEAGLRMTGNLPALYHEKTRELLARVADPVAYAGPWCVNVLAVVAYLGLFLLPLLLYVPRTGGGSRAVWGVVVTGVGAVIAGGLAASRIFMPFLGNILHDAGLGPIRLRDVHILGLVHRPVTPVQVLVLITACAVLGGVWLVLRVAAVVRARGAMENPAVSLCVATAVLYGLPMILGSLFDRYLVVLVPLIGVILIPGADRVESRPSRWRAAIAVLVVAGSAVFSVGATRDYFAWNRARWQAIDEWVGQRGVPVSSLDGGFECNGWYGYDAGHPLGLPLDGPVSWWWVRDDEYVVAMGPMPGYRVVGEYGFTRLVPPGQGTIVMLQRDSAAAP